jgi:hypothetical protein
MLVNEAIRNWRKEFPRFREYTYKVRTVTRERTKEGRIKEESSIAEGIFPNPKVFRTKKRLQHWVMIEKNGKPVPPGRIAKEWEKLGKRLERAEREAEGAAPTEPWRGDYLLLAACVRGQCLKVFGEPILEGCDLSTPQRETVGGREMIAIAFRPRPDAVFPEEYHTAHQAEGKLWIDAADRIIARVALWPKGATFDDTSSDALLRGAAAARDWMRTKEGAWLIRYTHVNALAYQELFPRVEVEYMTESFDHRHFHVEVEEEQLDYPKPRH